MRTRAALFTALATLLVFGSAKNSPGRARDPRHVNLTDATPFNRKGVRAGGRQMTRTSNVCNAILALQQPGPVVPAGTRVVIPVPAGGAQPGPPGIPVWVERPSTRRRVDPERVERISRQLESLLKIVQPEINAAAKGEFPRDLIPHLKQIEKLTKQLRREISS